MMESGQQKARRRSYHEFSLALTMIPCPDLNHLLQFQPEEINNFLSCCQGTRLHHLLDEGLNEETLQLLNKGADVNLKNKFGRTALHVAVTKESISSDTVKLIAEKTSDINTKDNIGVVALHLAVQFANFEAVKTILQMKGHLDIQDWYGSTPLHFAAHESLDLVKTLVEHGANVDLKNQRGETPLHRALKCENKLESEGRVMSMIKLLLDKGANINEQNVEGNTPLHLVGRHHPKERSYNLYNFLLNYGAQVHLQNKRGFTPIHEVIYEEHYLNMILATESGKNNINVRDDRGNSPLHMAATRSIFNTVKLLLDNGAVIDSKNYNDETPLHVVTADDETSGPIFSLLIDRGAEVSCRDNELRTSLHIASSLRGVGSFGQRLLKCTTLLAKGASANVQDVCGRTPLHNAVENSSLEIVQLLLESGAEVNRNNDQGETPLHISTRQSYYRGNNLSQQKLICETLLANRGTPNVQDDDGMTPLHNAVQSHSVDLVHLLLESGAEVNIKNEKGETPLHISTHLSRGSNVGLQELICTTLIANGATPNVQDVDGNTPLHFAVENLGTHIVQLLLENGAEVNTKNRKGESPLRYVRSVDTLEALLEKGARINEQDNYGRTVLHNIAKDNKGSKKSTISYGIMGRVCDVSRTVGKLLEWGASQNIKDNVGKLPSDYYSFPDAQKEYDIKRSCLFSTNKMERDLRFVSHTFQFKFHQKLRKDCCEEVDKMKLELLGNNSLYDIFIRYNDPTFLSNEELESAVLSRDLKVRYPVYSSLLTSTYHRSRERVQLFESVADILQTPLPFEVMRYILTFVDDDSLRNVIEAKEEFSIEVELDSTLQIETESESDSEPEPLSEYGSNSDDFTTYDYLTSYHDFPKHDDF